MIFKKVRAFQSQIGLWRRGCAKSCFLVPLKKIIDIFLIRAHWFWSCANILVTFLVNKKKMCSKPKIVIFAPLDCPDHHQILGTSSEREYYNPKNFHPDRTTPDQFLIRFSVHPSAASWVPGCQSGCQSGCQFGCQAASPGASPGVSSGARLPVRVPGCQGGCQPARLSHRVRFYATDVCPRPDSLPKGYRYNCELYYFA